MFAWHILHEWRLCLNPSWSFLVNFQPGGTQHVLQSEYQLTLFFIKKPTFFIFYDSFLSIMNIAMMKIVKIWHFTTSPVIVYGITILPRFRNISEI